MSAPEAPLGPLAFVEHLIAEHHVEVVAVRLGKVGAWEVEIIFPKMGDWGRDILLSGVGPTLMDALSDALAPLERKIDENVSGSVKSVGN